MGLEISLRSLLAAALLAACCNDAAQAEPIRVAGPVRPAMTETYPYYVEFRAAVDGVYGHSYIAYGRLNAVGQPATATYADIHPTGDIPSMVLGHFFPVDAATTPEKDTLGRKIASRFRRPLTPAEYERLNAIIARARAANHAWSILVYNCNDFVADVARGIGMKTPSTLSLPYDFIPRLEAMNKGTPRLVHALASVNKVAHGFTSGSGHGPRPHADAASRS